MKLGTKILISFVLIFGFALYYITHDSLQNIRFRYLEGVEDSLVDHSRILSSFLSEEMKNNSFPAEKLEKIFDRACEKNFSAKIYKLNKTNVDMRVYVTDREGTLIFDSQEMDKPGTDYSQWRDVYLTLRGEYGARSTKEDPNNPDSSILYVAAPVTVNDETVGVVTVAKPTTSINNFLKSAKSEIKARSIVAGFFVLLLSVFITFLITKPIKRLTQYANDIRDGKKATLPRMDRSEIGDMGRAFEKMREALEGKKYVENYVHTLTHEIKSPLSSIKGAAELLEEDMSADQRSRFLSNIGQETERIEKLIDRMLILSSIEGMNALEKREEVVFDEMVEDVLENMAMAISQKGIMLKKDFNRNLSVSGDPFLLRLAISNILQNAVDFSPEQGQITISTQVKDDILTLVVEDEGPGVEFFALEKLFDKFFSMRRPGTGQKSTGLGLNFVKEISLLHKGNIRLENIHPNGTRALFSLPL